MNSNTENNWRVLTMEVGHSNNKQGISIYENGIFLGVLDGERFFGYTNSTDVFHRGIGRNIIMGRMIDGAYGDTQKAQHSYSGEEVYADQTLPYDLALWEAHEEISNIPNIHFTAQQIYSHYVNKYKYDFINGVSTA